MQSYRAIAFDMDGTLLNNHKQILSGSIEAIGAASAAGKTVVLCTGRAVAEVKKFGSQLKGIHYAICSNGAVVYDLVHDNVIFGQPIPADTVNALFELTRHYDVYIQVMSLQSILEHKKHKHISDYHAEAYERLFNETGRFVEDLYVYWQTSSPCVYKFTPYAKTVSDRDALAAQLSALGVETAFAEATGVECSAPGISKGTGLKALCEYSGLSSEELIAVGDADNDLKMLGFAGLPIAMGNANKNVKHIAGAIVSDNENGGCAEAIYRYLLNEPQ